MYNLIELDDNNDLKHFIDVVRCLLPNMITLFDVDHIVKGGNISL